MTGLGGDGCPLARTHSGRSQNAESEGNTMSKHFRIRWNDIGIPPFSSTQVYAGLFDAGLCDTGLFNTGLFNTRVFYEMIPLASEDMPWPTSGAGAISHKLTWA